MSLGVRARGDSGRQIPQSFIDRRPWAVVSFFISWDIVGLETQDFAHLCNEQFSYTTMPTSEVATSVPDSVCQRKTSAISTEKEAFPGNTNVLSVFIKLPINVQSGPVILVILCRSH